MLKDHLDRVQFVGFKFIPRYCTIKLRFLKLYGLSMKAWITFCLLTCKISWLNLAARRLFSFSMMSFFILFGDRLFFFFIEEVKSMASALGSVFFFYVRYCYNFLPLSLVDRALEERACAFLLPS